MIHSIEIYDFRMFKDIDFKIGKNITVISGQNATGKSTLLGLIGNSAELKKKQAETVLNTQFRTEFSEIFKASETYDISGSNKYKILFTDYDFQEITDYRLFRTSWPKAPTKSNPNKKRFRVIPYIELKSEDGKRKSKKESKVEWPTLYLGLSRLFPIGEIKNDVSFNELKLDDKNREWLIDSYVRILNFDEDIKELHTSKIKEVGSKNAFAITTNEYDYLVNSSGQDNIGQILLALLSFIELSKKDNFEYSGGLLLIDEFDATLHPSVQKRLFDFMLKISKDFNIQIIFTTHSISLLQYIYLTKTQYNSNELNNSVELVYLTNANGNLKLHRNPNWYLIENDLTESSVIIDKKFSKITIYSEDNEARWFFKNLISRYSHRLNILDINMGYSELLKLRKEDPSYFSGVLFLLDGDVKNDNSDFVKNVLKRYNNILILPGQSSPECILHNYLISLHSEHEYWYICNTQYPEYGFSQRYFNSTSGPFSDKYIKYSKPREKYKKWFNDNLEGFETTNLFEIWATDNKKVVENFEKEFIKQFNYIANNKLIPKIHYNHK